MEPIKSSIESQMRIIRIQIGEIKSKSYFASKSRHVWISVRNNIDMSIQAINNKGNL